MKCLESLGGQYHVAFYGSGTQALALAVASAKDRFGERGSIEVVLPAYGCPALVSACAYAGVGVRLVDVHSDAWGYDIQHLNEALTPKTAAIVAVNLLGVGDQAALLRSVIKEPRCRLVQDSAQYLPDIATPNWCGDSVVLSFGRGKPLNLLHGGALLTRESWTLAAHADARERIRSWALSSGPAAVAFNIATSPKLYAITSRLSTLGIGETRYMPLRSCHQLSDSFRGRVASALSSFQGRENYSATRWRPILAEWEAMGIKVLSCAGEPEHGTQFLRLALLAPSERDRNRIVGKLTARGLGASAMYRVPLNRIANVPDSVARQGPFPGAEAFAGRVFTIPNYEYISNSIVERIDGEIRAATRT